MVYMHLAIHAGNGLKQFEVCFNLQGAAVDDLDV